MCQTIREMTHYFEKVKSEMTQYIFQCIMEMTQYFGKSNRDMTQYIFNREMTQYFGKRNREMTQDIVKVLCGNELIHSKSIVW